MTEFKKGTTVWVVGFFPSGTHGGIGGFDWNIKRVEAIKFMNAHLQDDNEEIVYVFRAIKLPHTFDNTNAVTSWLDKHAYGLWEFDTTTMKSI